MMAWNDHKQLGMKKTLEFAIEELKKYKLDTDRYYIIDNLIEVFKQEAKTLDLIQYALWVHDLDEDSWCRTVISSGKEGLEEYGLNSKINKKDEPYMILPQALEIPYGVCDEIFQSMIEIYKKIGVFKSE